ncbi:cytidine deaminase-like protein [Pluteus cervinus]|uniref:Cytidine deaminase-like protein n=1 Tax=Pluteus cervinus TaxID=181527 RepID=A0ACD3AMN1_9AGAR|nr:cytidine deaminase-like protein [Pluteus cervinus]
MFDQDCEFLRLALVEAEKCAAVPTAFSVGCVIAIPSPPGGESLVALSTGYSRELPGNTHAEANALEKARSLSSSELQSLIPSDPSNSVELSDLLATATVYTTLEPCSVRTSGLAPCADALIAAKIKRCVIGVGEPDDFVKCEGAQKLKDAGVEVVWLSGLEEECLKVARKGHETS